MLTTRYVVKRLPRANDPIVVDQSTNLCLQPISYLPLSMWHWQEAVKAVFSGKVSVVDIYPDVVVRASSLEIPLPSVIALNEYVCQPKNVSISCVYSKWMLHMCSSSSFGCRNLPSRRRTFSCETDTHASTAATDFRLATCRLTTSSLGQWVVPFAGEYSLEGDFERIIIVCLAF